MDGAKLNCLASASAALPEHIRENLAHPLFRAAWIAELGLADKVQLRKKGEKQKVPAPVLPSKQAVIRFSRCHE
jgi:hypothetical protein